MFEFILIAVGACGVAASIIAKVVYGRRSDAAENSHDAERLERKPLLSKPGRTESGRRGGDR
ncbi:MAG: hypothetical protein JWQ61_1537 [Collimonas fungivorans]|nr:hypothetical protein [Collimonas fungivorans]